MLPFKSIVHILCCLLTLTLAKDDPEYTPAWVGSYYNATAEVELQAKLGNWYRLGGEEGEMCHKHKNYTTTFKYDAILSVIERGLWNNGSNAFNIWLTLLPQTSPAFDLSSLGADFLYQRNNLSFPIYSVQPTPRGAWKPGNNSSPDIFDFKTNQVSGGAYNFSKTLEGFGLGWTDPSSFGNVTLPVCNETHLTNNYQFGVNYDPGWTMEGWPGFRTPNITAQFDDKTANLTFDGVFTARPYVRINGPDRSPMLGEPNVKGYIQVRFSGALDAYHSDSLSLDGKTPSWLRTVGFKNDSSNIGYNDVDESAAGKLRSGHGAALIAILLVTAILL
ncbi:hypothetical protein F53441_4607 [Fusarium austroafricanum]|uniref:Uncharacterized protein n=1 Tax=Fusarium austroafricanum TaxID=2364996 RepID=A0A8H4KMV6_9HYPO|nr:hypothetical protein F53441_4607 [Fusarium austroafricanum]